MRKPATGRPTFTRNKAAGMNLRTALKLLGKSWRRDVDSPGHVHHWINWTDCGLPSSATTIDSDIRLGVPEQRIAAYAMCLGIPPEAFCSAEVDMVALLSGAITPSGQQSTFVPPGYGEQFSNRYLEHNRPSYISDLFEIMGGVFRMDYLLQGVDLIHRCTLWVYGTEAHRLLMRGRFIMFGNENRLEAKIFRWHNNLHTHYLCENGLELGYTLTVDPLRHNIVLQRNPFWLRGTGMTDRGLADNQPITFMFRNNRLPLAESLTQEELWLRECEDMRAHPFIAPDEPDYERIHAEILGAGVRFVMDSGLTLTTRYQGEIEEYGHSHSLLLEAQWVF